MEVIHEAINKDKNDAHAAGDTAAFTRSEKSIDDTAKAAAKLNDKMPSLSGEDE